MEKKELKKMAIVLQELGLSYSETIEVMKEIAKDVNNAQKLWRGEKKLFLHLDCGCFMGFIRRSKQDSPNGYK